ncbi:DUF3492 domain-containing protein [Streptomyces armeniacus]|uniref:D-inositol 3-phosphate glycosyltransferase n=1 Tax=Streptomyces armeniacus TaxID=83291 RepID=A0A345XIU0_9ACTN|nr:DUF3492 domain-containing protein [Streptomyces armeniacus]AXK31556.1 DUF3492 domain-containing protein [Streptomyces armeniacus]
MRVALLTEGGYPSARGESVLWCDRLLRGLDSHEFEIYALTRSARQEEAGWCDLPRNVARVSIAPLWGGAPAAETPAKGGGRGVHGRRERRRFEGHFKELADAVCSADPDDGSTALADRFASGLYGLADLARQHRGLPAALRSELAVRILESACRAPGALRAAQSAKVPDLLAVVDRLERALRPLSLDWYGEADGDSGLAAADLCHAVGGGTAALAGLLAARSYGTPLLVTEYGVRLREHYLASAADAVAPAAAGAPVRALLASFQGRLARETYAQAQLITPGNAHARRWQERCGARRERLRTVYPGMDAAPFAAVVEETAEAAPRGGSGGGTVLVWVGRIAPAKDLVALLHAFAEVRKAVPRARLRIVETPGARDPAADDYAAHCRELAAQLFPDGVADGRPGRAAGRAGGRTAAGRTGGGARSEEAPVTFEEVGSPAVPTLADAYASAGVVVLSSVVEGFPVSLVEAMFCARATVSTDAGAVCEVIGGTGLVVPQRDPRALAEACVALLRDPARRARLGAAARARALELFTAEQNIEAFRGIYLELMSHCPVRRESAGTAGEDGDARRRLPFARPAEAHVPGRWAGTTRAQAGQSGGAVGPSAGGHRPNARTEPQPGAPRPGTAPSWARRSGRGDAVRGAAPPRVGVRHGKEDPK